MTQTDVNLCAESRAYKRCRNRANGDDGLCGVCRGVVTRRAERDQQWERQLAAWQTKRQQAAFVTAWREQHPDLVYGASWACPLCGKILQAGENQEAYERFVETMADKHRRYHGGDWTRYQALADGATD